MPLASFESNSALTDVFSMLDTLSSGISDMPPICLICIVVRFVWQVLHLNLLDSQSVSVPHIQFRLSLACLISPSLKLFMYSLRILTARNSRMRVAHQLSHKRSRASPGANSCEMTFIQRPFGTTLRTIKINEPR